MRAVDGDGLFFFFGEWDEAPPIICLRITCHATRERRCDDRALAAGARSAANRVRRRSALSMLSKVAAAHVCSRLVSGRVSFARDACF